MTSQQTLSSKVALTFSCKGLKDKDVTSKSDPIIQVLMEDSRRQTWKEVRKHVYLLIPGGNKKDHIYLNS